MKPTVTINGVTVPMKPFIVKKNGKIKPMKPYIIICLVLFFSIFFAGCGVNDVDTAVVLIRYIGVSGGGTYGESDHANLLDGSGSLVYVLFNSDDYDTVTLKVEPHTVRFIDNYKYRAVTFVPAGGAKYTVQHPTIEID